MHLFGCDEPRCGALRKIRHDCCGFRSIDQARAPQQRSKIMHFTAMIENLAVKTRKEFRETHVFLARDFFKRIPERHLQPDGRAMAIDTKRSGLRFIVPLGLVSEQLAHKLSSRAFYGFSKRYTRPARLTINSGRDATGVSGFLKRNPSKDRLIAFAPGRGVAAR